MTDRRTSVGFLRKQVSEFIKERDWERFHNPKDLAVSISIEAAEFYCRVLKI